MMRRFALFIILLTSCIASPAQPSVNTASQLPAPAATLPKINSEAQQIDPTPNLLSIQAPTLPTTPAPLPIDQKAFMLPCSPLQGITIGQLSDLVNNPFQPPPPGRDDPHYGIDLAITKKGVALAGHPVQAIFSGQVAAIIKDRFPYGNALLIETQLAGLPSSLIQGQNLATPPPTIEPHPALTCPQPPDDLLWEFDRRSLYILYAHLQNPTPFLLDESVPCSAVLGQIGQSGNALNPHLHLETRIGPSGARFSSMAHYASSASPEEMSNYCTWRVRGVFQAIDPLILLSALSP